LYSNDFYQPAILCTSLYLRNKSEPLKKLLSILLLLIFLLPGMAKLWIAVDFKINQAFIAENYCINKDDPVLMCSGKCYLSQQLQEAEEPYQQDLPFNAKLKIEIQLYLEAFCLTLRPVVWSATQSTEFPDHSILPVSAYLNSVFHPPETPFFYS
jgi:hypothetical protein